jgi:acid phosphatase family membrane protein YuiD
MNFNLNYLITPFLTWFLVGSLKFLINSYKIKQLAFGLIGYGGMPSNHSAIVCSIVSLIFFDKGVNEPAFGVALALAFIVLLDAKSLRSQVGFHAKALNKLNKASKTKKMFRERLGHSYSEIALGCFVGILIGYFVYSLSC